MPIRTEQKAWLMQWRREKRKRVSSSREWDRLCLEGQAVTVKKKYNVILMEIQEASLHTAPSPPVWGVHTPSPV